MGWALGTTSTAPKRATRLRSDCAAACAADTPAPPRMRLASAQAVATSNVALTRATLFSSSFSSRPTTMFCGE
eukprot:scaffold74366_cov67-Phaeocystis_antarctica.AAC.5